MRAVFMGTPSFAVPTLQALFEKHEVAAVVTQPDKPSGRGKKVKFSPVKELALERGAPVLQPVKVREAAEELAAYQADVFIVAAYGQILPEKILLMPKHGCLNVHGSLLPKYRGAAPVHHAVMNGDEKTGVTIMYMDKGMDTGDMLLARELPITLRDTTGTLLEKLALLGAEAMLEALALLERGAAPREKQDGARASYAGMITKEMGRIDWRKSGADIVNLVRGLSPAPCAYALLDGQPLKIWAAEALPPVEARENARQPGEVVSVDRGLEVMAGVGSVLVTELQARGGKRMSARDYLRGHSLEIGSVLN